MYSVNVRRPGNFVDFGEGGAIEALDTDMKIIDSVFSDTDSAAESGGAVYCPCSGSLW